MLCGPASLADQPPLRVAAFVVYASPLRSPGIGKSDARSSMLTRAQMVLVDVEVIIADPALTFIQTLAR